MDSELLPDGVHIGLSEAAYFKQKRRGSSDFSKLCRGAENWWYGSEHNPHREEKKWVFGNERDFGHGLHYLLLEGEAVYRAKTEVCEFDNFGTKDAKAWRDEMHADQRVILSEAMDRNIRHMVALIANHPQLGEPMAAGLSEVSVFWTDEQGHRFRARFDKLLPAFVLDPKSYGAHHRGRDDEDRALRIVASMNYDVQRYLYDVAREKLIEFVRAGKVYGGTEADRAWVGRFPDADHARLEGRQQLSDHNPDKQSAWSWVWIFFQRRDDKKGHAPIVLPIERPRFDKTWHTGKAKVELALANYDRLVAKFGLGDIPDAEGRASVPWAKINPLWRPLDEQFPPWMSDIASPEHGGADTPEGDDQ